MSKHPSINNLKLIISERIPTLKKDTGSCKHFLLKSGNQKAEKQEEKTLTLNGGALRAIAKVNFILFDTDNTKKTEDG